MIRDEGWLRPIRFMMPPASLATACARSPILTVLRLERDSFSFNVHLLLGGQVRGQEPNLYLIYPQGNPLAATEDSLYLQLGECKYGRPILDRGIQSTTSLEVAAKYALLSLDATMRSNVTVGPPFDLLLYKKDSLEITRYRRVSAGDRDLNLIHSSWEQSLRRAVEQLPDIEFQSSGSENPAQSIREVARTRVVGAPSSFFNDANRFSRSPIRRRYAILAGKTAPQS